jgi:carboxymethylenebutenolidase
MNTRDIDHAVLKGGGYLAFPDGSGPHPGVVVIHEAYGVNDNIKKITTRLAENGYVGLAVDLFSDRIRALCMARYMAGMLRGSVDRFGVDDLKGAIGFCMGGSFAVAWACTDDRLKAIAPYYAVNPRPIAATQRMCPVVGSYPEKDFTAGAGRALEIALTRNKIDHDIKIYPGTRHSFFNEDRGAYNKQAADDSWRRVMSFFETHLGTKTKTT